MNLLFILFKTFFKDFIYLFLRERKGERKRGGETPMCERNIGQLPLARPQLGTWPAIQLCALTGNQTSDLSVCGHNARPTGPHQSGLKLLLKKCLSEILISPVYLSCVWRSFIFKPFNVILY